MRNIFSGFNTIICSASALAVLASCSRELETDICTDRVPIAFGGSLSAETMVTRAASVVGLEEVTDSFIVTGYKYSATDGWQDVMNSYKVCYVSNTDGSSVTNTASWEYVGQGPDQVTKYWDFSATDYHFMGYVPKRSTGKIGYSGSMSSNGNNIVLTLSGVPRIAIAQNGVMTNPDGVTVTEQDLPLLSRLWHGTAPQNEPVRMEFVKPYAKLCVYLMRAGDVAAQAVTDITLAKSGGQIPLTGTVSASYSLTDTTYSISGTGVTGGNNITFGSIAAEEMANANIPCPVYPQYLLLPDSDNDCDYTFTCAGRDCIIPAALMQLEPGYCYSFIFKLTQSDASPTKSALTDNPGLELMGVNCTPF